MTDFLDEFSLRQLGALRSAEMSGEAVNDAEIVPGVYLSWDAEEASVTVRYESPDWAALSLVCQVTGRPRWQSLNLALGEGWFVPGDVIGVVVEGYAEGTLSLSVRMRTRSGGDVLDCEWEDALTLEPTNGVAVALRTLEAVDGCVSRDGYHTLILGLPGACALTLREIRVFRIPGSAGLRSVPETLSSFAV
jgi:hypothetical protein